MKIPGIASRSGGGAWTCFSRAFVACQQKSWLQERSVFNHQASHKLQQTRPTRIGVCFSSGDDPLYRLGAQSRVFSSSTAIHPELNGDADERFLHVLRCEVEDLLKRSKNIIARKPPKPFTLVKDEPDELEITLNRIYGLEDISMSCILHVVPKEFQRKPEIGEDPEVRKKMLQLSISITKGGAPDCVLKMKCEGYRDGFAIHQVDLESKDEEQSVYRPYFSESKQKLVNNFQIFLYNRGLNADLSKYIEMHLEKKRLLRAASMIQKIQGIVV